jgi:exodeoxyribonuclease-3
VKLATWNINGIVKRLDQLVAWLQDAAPDIVCLQELKRTPSQFPEAALMATGYGAVWVAEGRWNGVAILSRSDRPSLTRSSLPGYEGDLQARYIEAAVGGRLVASVYVPNGNPVSGPKFDYKLAWMDRLHTHAEDLLNSGGYCQSNRPKAPLPAPSGVRWTQNAIL